MTTAPTLRTTAQVLEQREPLCSSIAATRCSDEAGILQRFDDGRRQPLGTVRSVVTVVVEHLERLWYRGVTIHQCHVLPDRDRPSHLVECVHGSFQGGRSRRLISGVSGSGRTERFAEPKCLPLLGSHLWFVQ